jgi:Zn-finger nucleic acid-binding protein
MTPTRAKPAKMRYCPSCGGPDDSEGKARKCTYCSGPLVPLGTPDPRVTIRCSSCASAMPQGSSFCAGCGECLALLELEHPPSELKCPGCSTKGGTTRTTMLTHHLLPNEKRLAGWPVHGCRSCGGVWVGAETLNGLIETAAATGERVTVAGTGEVHRRQLPRGSISGPVVYRRCAECNSPMMRRNFARISGVIVDACGQHGTYFDAGELEDVLAFVQTGGLAAARTHMQAEEVREARMRRSVESTGSVVGTALMTPVSYHHSSSGAGAITLGVAFARWIAGWIGRLVSGN